MKTKQQIEKMIQCVKSQYECLPAFSAFGHDNHGTMNHIVATLQKVIDQDMSDDDCLDRANDEYDMAPEPEGKHYDAAQLLEWVASVKPDDTFESDWGYNED